MNKKYYTSKKYHYGMFCYHCWTGIYSMSHHDYRHCRCKYPEGVMVDGGYDYFRHGWTVGWKNGYDYKIIKEKIK